MEAFPQTEASLELLQLRVALRGKIDSAQIRTVCQKIIQVNNHSHTVNGNGNGNGKLQTEPTQLRRLSWQEHDLRGLSAEEVQTWSASFLETDRSQKIPAEHSGLMRVALIHTADREGELVWSSHPSLLDRDERRRIAEELGTACGATVLVEQISDIASEKQNVLDSLVPVIVERSNGKTNGTAETVEAPSAPDETETKLIAIWEAVLNTRPVRATDDFFDLGGHSLLAARLLARIEESMGVELPLASLLEAPTIRAQAGLVRAMNGKTEAVVATPPARAKSANPVQLPLFFLGGDPTFRPLSQRLGELREFHALGMQGSVVAALKNPESMECIAEQFVKAIRERQREGPYVLSGWCAHGMLAYETARQLRAQGQEVAQVILLETVNPARLRAYRGWKRLVANTQFKLHLLKFERAYLGQLNKDQARNYLAGRIAQKLKRLKESLRRTLNINKLGSTQFASENPVDVLYAAAAKYTPPPYDGHVALIRGTQRTIGFARELDWGWKEILGDKLEVCETPGNHYTIYMHPNVDTLALKINEHLRKAEKRTQDATVLTTSH